MHRKSHTSGKSLLKPNRKYWIVRTRDSRFPSDRIQIYYKRSDDVDTGQPGWLLSHHLVTVYRILVTRASPASFSLRLEGIILAPVTNEPRYRDFPMDTSTLGRLKLGETSTGTLDATDDNLSGDLIKIEGLTPGNSYRVRAWFGTSKEDSTTAARGGAIGLQFSRAQESNWHHCRRTTTTSSTTDGHRSHSQRSQMRNTTWTSWPQPSDPPTGKPQPIPTTARTCSRSTT